MLVQSLYKYVQITILLILKIVIKFEPYGNGILEHMNCSKRHSE